MWLTATFILHSLKLFLKISKLSGQYVNTTTHAKLYFFILLSLSLTSILMNNMRPRENTGDTKHKKSFLFFKMTLYIFTAFCPPNSYDLCICIKNGKNLKILNKIYLFRTYPFKRFDWAHFCFGCIFSFFFPRNPLKNLSMLYWLDSIAKYLIFQCNY